MLVVFLIPKLFGIHHYVWITIFRGFDWFSKIFHESDFSSSLYADFGKTEKSNIDENVSFPNSTKIGTNESDTSSPFSL